MNREEIRSILKDLTEQKAPAEQIDLWPAIQTRIQMSQPTPSGGTIMNTQSNPRQSPRPLHLKRLPLTLAYLLAAILMIGVLFLVIPQGRALAQQIQHFFNRGESNVMAGVTVTPVHWVEQTPGVAAPTLTPQPPQPTSSGPDFETDCGSFMNAHCSIDAIRERAGFPVFALPEVPEGLIFTGATGGPDQVYLFYNTPKQTGNLTIWEEPLTGDGSPQTWEVGADADIQTVQIGAVTGEYLKGTYDGSSSPPVWNPNANMQTLRWVNGGVLINLMTAGTDPNLSRDELIALAATLTDGPVGVSGVPVAAAPTQTAQPTPDPHIFYPLTIAEAEEKAGFALLTPARLPENLTFVGANYDEQTKVVTVSYIYHHPIYPDAQGGLLVSMQRAAEGVDCDLCGFIQGNGKQVDQYPVGKLVSKDAPVETVQLGEGQTGQYVEGIGWTSKTECCGWQWDPTPFRKRLRFRADDLAIEVWADVYDLSREDFMAIVESLK